jgi:hypothetical protein
MEAELSMQPLPKECEITEGTIRFRLRKTRRNARRVSLLPQVMSGEFSLDQQAKTTVLERDSRENPIVESHHPHRRSRDLFLSDGLNL